MRLVVCFDNLGPYHIARLREVNRHCELAVIQYRLRSAEYRWETCASQLPHVSTISDERIPSLGAAYRRIDFELRRAKPDVIAIPGWASEFAHMLMRWSILNGVPMVLMSDSQKIDFPRTRAKEYLKRKLVSLFSGALVAGTRHREYLVFLGFDPARVRLGYDAVDNEYFTRRSEEARREAPGVRLRYGLPESFILCCARLVEKKNLEFLVSSYRRYRSDRAAHATSRVDRHLVIVGDGPLKARLLDKIASTGFSDKIRLSGYVDYDELPAYYALADYFVLPSVSEQWGLVVNEAMACGLPVLVSNHCGCSKDLVQEGANGFTFDPCEETSLQSAFGKMDVDEAALSRMASVSREIVSGWGLDRFSKALLDVARLACAEPVPNRDSPGRFALESLVLRTRWRLPLFGKIGR